MYTAACFAASKDRGDVSLVHQKDSTKYGCLSDLLLQIGNASLQLGGCCLAIQNLVVQLSSECLLSFQPRAQCAVSLQAAATKNDHQNMSYLAARQQICVETSFALSYISVLTCYLQCTCVMPHVLTFYAYGISFSCMSL